MALLHNNLPVIGIVVTDGSQRMFNNQPVIGVRAAEDDAAFVRNHVVRGVEEVTNGAAIWNDQPVRGVFEISDDRTVWNGQPVTPVSGLIWKPEYLFSGDRAGFWQGGSDPSLGRLMLSSTVPAMLPGELIYQANRADGSVDAGPQAAAANRPTLARWPETGRRNLLTQTEFPNGLADTGVREGVSITPMSGFQNGILFPDAPAVSTYAYKSSLLLVDGQQYSASAFVRMNDGGAPSFNPALNANGSAQDFCFSIKGNLVVPTSTVDLGGGLYRVSTTYTPASGAGLMGVIKYSTNSPRGFVVSGYQLEHGPAATAYQRVGVAADVSEAGVPAAWHLSNDGTDILPISLPAGTYGRATLDHLGAVVIDTVANPANTLMVARQRDVILRFGAFTAQEIVKIQEHWAAP